MVRSDNIQSENLPRYIIVEGPIGSGKTTLAKRLAATLSYQLLLEEWQKNPFLHDFYRKNARAALATELFFLFQRARQAEEFQNARQNHLFTDAWVADFMWQKSEIFTEINLNLDENEIYRRINELVQYTIPPADLVIYVHASVDILLQRIYNRAEEQTKHIKRAYLEKITAAYSRFFRSYDESPVLIINTSNVNFAVDNETYGQLITQLSNMRHPRHHFDPSML